MEIQRRLGCRHQCRRLLVGQFGRLQRGVPHGAVVPDGSDDVLGVADRLLDASGVPRAVVAGRPVAPEVIDEGVVVQGERDLRRRGQEEEHVPALLQLRVGEERHADGCRRGDGRRDGPAPAVGLVGDGAVGGQSAPVVADDDGVATAPEDLVQRIGVLHQRSDLIAPVGRNGGRGVAALERRHGPEARRRQFGQQVAPRVRRIGEAVQAEGERPVLGPIGQAGEFQPVGSDGPLFCRHRRRTYCAGAG